MDSSSQFMHALLPLGPSILMLTVPVSHPFPAWLPHIKGPLHRKELTMQQPNGSLGLLLISLANFNNSRE